MRQWTALSGAAFVMLFALAAGLYGGGAGSGAPDILAYYSRPTSWRHQEYGFAVLLVACLFLLHYVAELRARVNPPEPAGTVLILSGGATVVLLMIANALWAATAFTVQIQRAASFTDPSAHLLVEDAAFVFLVTAAAAAIPMVIVASVEGLRRRVMPLWFTILGVLALVGLVTAYWYFPLSVFLLWIAVGSVLLSRSRPVGEDVADQPVIGRSSPATTTRP
jgi:hypothetical protein